MTKREAARILRDAGWRQDVRPDHREWWKQGHPLRIYLDGPRARKGKITITGDFWPRFANRHAFNDMIRIIGELDDRPRYDFTSAPPKD